MSLEKIRREAETISRYADRIERSDPTHHVGAMGYAARHILVMLDRLDRLEDSPDCPPRRCSKYVLWKCHCGYETLLDSDRMPPIQERCGLCHPKPYGTKKFSGRMYEECSEFASENLKVRSPVSQSVPGRMSFTVLERKG